MSVRKKEFYNHPRSTIAEFTSFTHHRLLVDAIRHEVHRDEQELYRDRIMMLENNLLRRTILITGVANCVRYPDNLSRLKRFLNQSGYGPIEACFVANDDEEEADDITTTTTSTTTTTTFANSNQREGGRLGQRQKSGRVGGSAGRGTHQIRRPKYNDGRRNNMDQLLDADRAKIERDRNAKNLRGNKNFKALPAVRVRFRNEQDCNKLLSTVSKTGGYLPCPGLACIPAPKSSSDQGNYQGQGRGRGRGERGRNGRANHQGNNRNSYSNSYNNNETSNPSNNNNNNNHNSNNVKMIHIEKSKHYPNIISHTLENPIINISSSGLSLGHWTADDMYTQWMQQRHLSQQQTQQQKQQQRPAHRTGSIKSKDRQAANNDTVKINSSSKSVKSFRTSYDFSDPSDSLVTNNGHRHINGQNINNSPTSFHQQEQQQQQFPPHDIGQWLEVCRLENPLNDLGVSIDLSKRIIELSVSRQTTSSLDFDFSDSTDFMTFRFKDIDGYIDLCRVPSSMDTTVNNSPNKNFSFDDDYDDNGIPYTYSLIFSPKYPPRLYSNRPTFGLGFAFDHDELKEYQRDLVFGGIEGAVFGMCHGIKLDLSLESVEMLLLNKGLDRMKAFGLIRDDVNKIRDAMTIQYIHITTPRYKHHENTVERFVMDLHKYNPRLGFTFRSLLDQGKFTWYHAMFDTAPIVSTIVSDENDDRDDYTYGSNEIVATSSATVDQQQQHHIFYYMQYYPAHIVEVALNQIAKSNGKTRCPCKMFQMLIDLSHKEPQLQDHCASIPRVLLTPCKQLSMGFESETSNRVIRKFVEEEGFQSHSFLRLHVGDENSSKLFSTDLADVVVQRIKSAILNGIVVNGVRYEFLAYSSSQLKEFSVWMTKPENGWSTESMRASMGDFSGCNTPSKYAARIGQCFSTTFQSLAGQDTVTTKSKQPPLQHIVVNDLLTRDLKMNHSDGCGLISKKAMTTLLAMLPYLSNEPKTSSSVVQIRYGGAKGVMIAWEDHVIEQVVRGQTKDRTKSTGKLPSYDVVLRDSMVKFVGPYHFLEICKVGCRISYYLNRNVILLLVTRGVHPSVFKSKQSKMLDELDTMLGDKETAVKLLGRLGGPDQCQRTRLLQILQANIHPAKDPFLFSCCLAIRSHHLYGLRKKARVFVDDGAVLIGGVDETKLLPEFCVFLQIRKYPTSADDIENEDGYEPIVGPVMVTKHPVMYPGDVRMLLAIDLPELRDKKNVILFSQHGYRPEPNKMAGSDLDGDEYSITWDPSLFLGEWNGVIRPEKGGTFISNKGRPVPLTKPAEAAITLQLANCAPLEYDALPNKRKNIRIDNGGLVEHFINFAKNDNLGRIGMLWQDWAAKKRADGKECIELAKQYTVAVDFAKTGIPASIPECTRWSGPRAHWREKSDEQSYHCKTVIGQMYDDVILRSDKGILRQFKDALAGRFLDRYGQVLSIHDKDTGTSEYLRNIYQPHIPAKLGWPRNLNALNHVQKRISSFAHQQRLLYEEHATQIMNKYNLRNEGELFTGCIRKYHRLHKKRQHEVSEDVRRQCRSMCEKFREAFFLEVIDISESCYCVTPLALDIASSTIASHVKHATIIGPSGERLRDLSHEDTRQESIIQVEKWATDLTLPDQNKDKRSSIVRKTARELAAAYYIDTYSPARQFHDEFALFSFPWLVSDVIACGIQDPSASKKHVFFHKNHNHA